MELAGRVVLVTGGGRNIGRRIALTLAERGADAVLIAPERDELESAAAEIAGLGRRALPVKADVTRENEVATAVEQAVQQFGCIDLLVNNAGIAGPTAPLQEITLKDWNETQAVNLTGAFLCSKAVLPQMIERQSGKIVNISSIAGKHAYPLRSPYASSKWGLIGLTLSLAKELGRHHIQVNAVCPGPVEGERMRQVVAARARETGATLDEVRQEYEATTLLGRFVTEQDVADLVAYLASSSGDNITGQAIEVSAGYNM